MYDSSVYPITGEDMESPLQLKHICGVAVKAHKYVYLYTIWVYRGALQCAPIVCLA